MNPRYSGIATSLTLHAVFISLVLFLPSAKHPPVYDVIRVHFVEAPSSSAGLREAALPVKRPSPPVPNIQKRDVAVKPILPEREAQGMKPADGTVAVNVHNNVIGTAADMASKHIGRGQESALAGAAAKTAIVETAFGSSGAPSFIRRETPVYPPAARRLGKEGKVVLRLTIDSQGRVQAIEIIEDAGYGFSEAAVEAVRKSTFAPAFLNGQRITARAILPVRFRLQ